MHLSFSQITCLRTPLGSVFLLYATRQGLSWLNLIYTRFCLSNQSRISVTREVVDGNVLLSESVINRRVFGGQLNNETRGREQLAEYFTYFKKDTTKTAPFSPPTAEGSCHLCL